MKKMLFLAIMMIVGGYTALHAGAARYTPAYYYELDGIALRNNGQPGAFLQNDVTADQLRNMFSQDWLNQYEHRFAREVLPYITSAGIENGAFIIAFKRRVSQAAIRFDMSRCPVGQFTFDFDTNRFGCAVAN